MWDYVPVCSRTSRWRHSFLLMPQSKALSGEYHNRSQNEQLEKLPFK